jgi:hypothetical protein
MDNISFCLHAKKITFSSIFANRSGGKNIVPSFYQSGVEVSHLVPHSQLLRQCEIQAQLMIFFWQNKFKKKH